MPYFLCNDNLDLNLAATVSGEEARHLLLSHRLKVGERVKLQGPNGKRFLCITQQIKKDQVVFKVVESALVPSEPKIKVTLFQSVVSEKALDFIFQKGTELGLSGIVLFNSANTATKLSKEQFIKKQSRWNRILIESAKQCERQKWPDLKFVENLDEIVKTELGQKKVFLLDPKGDKKSFDASNGLEIGLIVGPEGGLNEIEEEKLRALPNVDLLTLGPVLLRAETAALASLSMLRSIMF